MKKFALSLLLTSALLLGAPTQAHAQDNFFQKVSHAVSNRMKRVYLMLPGDKSGAAVLQQSLEASKNMKSAQMKADFTVDLMKDDESLANGKLDLEGPVEIQAVYDPETYKQDLKMSGEVTMQGTTMRASADMKIAGENVYFKINEVPAVPYVDLSPLKGKWLKGDATSKKSSTKESLTEEQQKQLQAAYEKLMKNSQLGTAKKETKNDHAVYVMEVTIPKKALLEYLSDIEEVNSDNGATAESKEASRKEMEKFLDNVGDLKSTLWIDRSSFYVRHVEIPFVYTPEEKSESAMSASGPFAALADVNKIKVGIVVDMDDFNKKVTFEEPKDAQDLQEAVQEMVSASMAKQMPEKSMTPSELPKLTPQQKLQLQKYQEMQNSGTFPTGSGDFEDTSF